MKKITFLVALLCAGTTLADPPRADSRAFLEPPTVIKVIHAQVAVPVFGPDGKREIIVRDVYVPISVPNPRAKP